MTQVLAEGLKLLTASKTARQNAEARVRHEVLAGVRQIRAGKVLLLDEALVADIKARGRQRLAKSKLARRARGA